MRFQFLALISVFSAAVCTSALPQSGESASSLLNTRNADWEPRLSARDLDSRDTSQAAIDRLSAREASPYAEPEAEARNDYYDDILEKRVVTHQEHAGIHNDLAAGHTATGNAMAQGGHQTIADKHHAAAAAHAGAANAHQHAANNPSHEASAAAHSASRTAHAQSAKAHKASQNHH